MWPCKRVSYAHERLGRFLSSILRLARLPTVQRIDRSHPARRSVHIIDDLVAFFDAEDRVVEDDLRRMVPLHLLWRPLSHGVLDGVLLCHKCCVR